MFDGPERHGGDLLGRRRHRQPGQGNHPAGKDEKNKPFEARGGVMDGEQLRPSRSQQVAKWPSRTEQLSILLGPNPQPGRQLASQLIAVGGALASQIEQKGRGGEREAEEDVAGSRPQRR